MFTILSHYKLFWLIKFILICIYYNLNFLGKWYFKWAILVKYVLWCKIKYEQLIFMRFRTAHHRLKVKIVIKISCLYFIYYLYIKVFGSFIFMFNSMFLLFKTLMLRDMEYRKNFQHAQFKIPETMAFCPMLVFMYLL